MISDRDLLSRYLSEGSEAAFTELVDRYLALVRGIVWRRTRRAELVDEVAMAVFAALARKAAALRQRDSLAGWITLATRMQSAEALRREDARRRLMKSLANEPSDPDDGGDEALWREAAEHLDDALTNLPEREREAVMLRFYHHLSFREMGERFGRSEDAARKRVAKALARMESFFRRRGVAVSATFLAAGLAARLTGTAHALASGASSAAIAKGALAASSAAAPASLFTSLTFAMTLHKTWLTLTLAAALVFLSTGAGYLAGHQRGNAHRVALLVRLEVERQELPEPVDVATASRGTPAEAVSVKALIDQIAALSKEVGKRPSAWAELARLRETLPPDRFEEAFAIAQADYASDPALQATLVSYVLMDWAKHDARAATRAAASAGEGDRLEGLLAATLPEWGKADPEEAIGWMKENEAALGSGAALRLNATIFGGWASVDPNAAMNAFEALDYDHQRQVMGSLWTAARDESVREVFARRVGQIEDERLRVEILERSIIEALTQEPLAAAAAYDHLKLTDPGMQWRALNAVADQLYGGDPAATVKWIWERAPDSRRPDILSDWVASGWARKDRPAASAWLESQGYEPNQWLTTEEEVEP